MKRWVVPVVPAAVSLALSLATVGPHPYWQDSGLYLTAIKDLGLLYPPGFVLYEVLCRLWTSLLFVVDFTLAVHLFSSVCAAATVATMAVAVRDLLRSRGRLFQVNDVDPGDETAGACGLLTGVLLASGYTVAANAIYAKGYALYYWVLALLLWRMIRADESGRKVEFLGVAALIGLAWQVHPSAALGSAGLLFFVAATGRRMGWKLVLTGVGVAAACALGPSLLLLPWLTSRDPWLLMGAPSGLGEALVYVSGRRFVSMAGVFGLDASRVGSFGLFLFQEFLPVGLLLLAVGVALMGRRRPRLLVGILAWTLPYVIVTILFKIEGQHDCWFVAAWLPLYLAVGVGALGVSRRLGVHAPKGLVGAAGIVIVLAVVCNYRDLYQRDYRYAEAFGETLLGPTDKDSILVLAGDDANALVSYLQRVRGERPDVLLVTASFLNADASGFPYDGVLLRRQPSLRPPDYAEVTRQYPQLERREAAVAAFLNANAEGTGPIFCDRLVPLEALRRDFTLVPAGVLWKLVRRGPQDALDLKYWAFPIEPEDLAGKDRRKRGQKVKPTQAGIDVAPQSYEDRLRNLLVMGRFHLAMAMTERGRFLQAGRLCESIMALGGEFRHNPEMIHLMGISLHAAGEDDRAEPALRRSAEIHPMPSSRATATFYLGQIALKKGKVEEARRLFQQALSTPGLDEATRREIESRLKTP